jgi:hypothetical protein
LFSVSALAGTPYAKRVIAFHGFPQRENGRPVQPGRAQNVLGSPESGPGQLDKVPAIGSGGEIVVDIGEGDEIVDLPGTDFKLWEHGAPENYWILAAQQPAGPWVFLGYAKGTTEFDLHGSRLPWVRYLALADLECVDEGEGSEAADFNAVEALHKRSARQPLAPLIPPAGRSLIGKWRYDGRFNTKPSALLRLLDYYDRVVPSVPSTFTYVDSENEEDYFTSPVIFMTGHRDFVLDAGQRQALREYVERGGFILADSCCGNPTFTAAFRREMTVVFPDMPFQRLWPDHDVYNLIERVDARAFPLEAMILNERVVILFSPIGLVCAWENIRCPRNHPTPNPADAFRLGVNIIVYALTN